MAKTEHPASKAARTASAFAHSAHGGKNAKLHNRAAKLHKEAAKVVEGDQADHHREMASKHSAVVKGTSTTVEAPRKKPESAPHNKSAPSHFTHDSCNMHPSGGLYHK